MTDQEITALARKYAEEILNDESYLVLPTNLLNNLHQKTAEYAEHLIRFLLRRYYLADKEKAKAFYNGDTFGELDFIELVSGRRILKSLFPEIAKEVEE